MMKSPMKPPCTYDEQLDILASRGLQIPDRKRGMHILRCSNYYRLSGYALSFKNEDGTFKEGTSIEKIYGLYMFDEKLRHLLFEIIEPVELRLRSELAYVLSNNHQTALAYMEPSICEEKSASLFAKHLSDHYEEVSKSIDYAFVRHNLSKYGGLPIWAAVELWSFGHLSSYFNTLNANDRKTITLAFNTDISRIGGWFQLLSTIRNICAHSGRIYNRTIKISAKLYPEDSQLVSRQNRLAETLVVLKRIYEGQGKWPYFFESLYKLVHEYRGIVDPSALGLPKYWYFAFTGERKDIMPPKEGGDLFTTNAAMVDNFE